MHILIAISIILGLHAYIGLRLLPPGLGLVAYVGWAVLLVLCLLIPLRIVLYRKLSKRVQDWLTWPVYVWLGLFFLLTVAVGLTDLVSLVVGLLNDGAGARLSWYWIAAGVSLALGMYGWVQASRVLRVVEVDVPLDKLSRAHHGLSVVQLTDVHIGPSLKEAFLRRVVERVNELSPDLVVITGDLVDGPVEALAPHLEPLRDLDTKHGVFFVTGNHEYYAGADAWCEHLESLGVQALRNRRVSIVVDGEELDLAGVDDLAARHFGGGMRLDQALAGRDPSRELVLLAHQPRVIHQASQAGVGLQLSGHTHGGQIWPWHYLVRLQQPYNAGLVQHGGTQLYVSRGTGYWGPPIRLGAPAEITRLRLVQSRRSDLPRN